MGVVRYCRTILAKLAALAVLLGPGSFICHGQDFTPPIPLRLAVHSTVLNEDRTVLVRLPRSYANGGTKYPVLYLTDGDAHINEIGSTIDFLATNDRMPELIVVGILHTDRYRDLTPTRADITKRDGTIVFRVPTSGGADKFLKFFESELIPEIQKRYRTEPYRIFAGHSLGGLFALHALITKPELFQAYIAVSPSLEWDNEVVLRHFEDFLAAGNQLKGTLFFTLSDEGVVVARFNDDFEHLRRSLTANASVEFQWDSLVMKDEDHGSGVLRAHYAGLRKIFQDWQIPKNPTTQIPVEGLSGIEQHYSQLSRRLGYKVSAEKAIDDLGYQLMASNEAKDALTAFKRNVELYPDSANAYNSLADCYEALGEPELAKRNVSKAIELARRENSSRLTEFQKHLKTLTDSAPRSN